MRKHTVNIILLTLPDMDCSAGLYMTVDSIGSIINS
jgi:hypothetical protein